MTGDTPRDHGRWGEYFICHGKEARAFWSRYLDSASRDVLFVVGLGFDPRTNLGVSELMGLDRSGRRDCVYVELDEGPKSPSRKLKDRIEGNRQELNRIFRGESSIRGHTLKMLSDDQRRVGSRRAAGVIGSTEEISEYTDVVVDISALPRTIFCPLIARLLRILESLQESLSGNPPNLHVIVSENPGLDGVIRSEGLEQEAMYVHGFSGSLDLESNRGKPRLWMPILGEGQIEKLERILTKVNPDEICPILPFPSGNPRRGDDLILEYREFLFDSLGVETKNILYADESNPFDVYRRIRRTVIHYGSSLGPLGGCMTAVSALSSKLLTLGALLAAIELEIGMAQVESHGYRIVNEEALEEEKEKGELFELWLAGDPYE